MTTNVHLSKSAHRRLLRSSPMDHVAAGILARVCATVRPFIDRCKEVCPQVLDDTLIAGVMRRLSVFPNVAWRLQTNGDLIAVMRSAEMSSQLGSPEDWYQEQVAVLVTILTERVWKGTEISLHSQALSFLSDLNIAPIGPLATYAG